MPAKTVRTELTSGAIEGFTRDGVNRWRSIPYAKPPVGALRFKAPPQPVEAWDASDPATDSATALHSPPADTPSSVRASSSP